MSTVSTSNTTNTTNTANSLTIKGLIGKEFLYDENLFISNYNPFVTTNTSGINGLYPDTTLTGKLYIFNKKEYKEPSKEEFQNIKSISELTTAPYRLINESTFNYLSVSILSKYNENSKERTFQLIKENSVGDINPILSNGLSINDFLYNPENNNLGTFAILVIDHSTETGKLNKKTYTDLAVGEQFLMYLIPSELINISESGTDSTKLISLTLSDASKLVLSEFGNYPDDSVENKIDQRTNFFPNKFGTRIKEELYTNLLVKQNQVLKFINNNNITFSIDGGVLNKITLVEMDKYLILPENTDIFLNWIKELCFNNALDRYNDFLIIGSILNSTSRNYDLIIPDIIFNILGMKELYPLNSIIFKEYLISNPPSIIIDPNNVITEKFIDIILYCFYNNIVKSKDNIVLNNKTQITYNMSGIILPDFSQFNFNKNSMNYKFIFTPQYHDKLDTKNIELRKNYNKTLPKESKYSYNQNNNYSTRIRKKIEELKEEYKTDFDYYVSPTGKNTNSGLHPEFPKDTLTDIPSGSKVLLLPGDYSTIITSSYASRTDIYTRYTSTNYYIKLFNGMSGNLKIYGCGDKYPLKILNVSATYSTYESPPYHMRATSYFTFSSIKPGYPQNIEYFNLTIDFLCTSDSSGVSGKSFRFGEGYSSFYNCKFNTLKDYMKEGAKYYNCIFSETGTMYGKDVPTISIKNTQEDLNFFSDPVNEIKWYKDSIDFLKNNYLHEPMYTLIPIGNEGEENVIQLETTNNITSIPNLNYKLS